MDDLYALYPYVNTLAVVPVGLTKFRDGLTQVKPLDEEDAKKVLEMTDRFAQKCKEENGCRFVYCSDEFYLKAKKDFPTYGEYGSFSQIEDGVGLITKFKKEFDDAVKNFTSAKEGSFTLVTGVSEADFSGYPDCRDTFIRSLNVTLNLAMEEQFVIHTPLMWIDKCQTWALADELGVLDLIRNETMTCYNGIQGDGCGHCPACTLRREGLEKYLAMKQGQDNHIDEKIYE